MQNICTVPNFQYFQTKLIPIWWHNDHGCGNDDKDDNKKVSTSPVCYEAYGNYRKKSKMYTSTVLSFLNGKDQNSVSVEFKKKKETKDKNTKFSVKNFGVMIQDSIQEIAQHHVVNPNGLCSSCVVEAIHNKGWAEYIAYSEKLKKTNEERLKILQ